jgi:hypothetical protein
MPNTGKEKKKAEKAAKTASKPTKMVQYPAAGGGSMNVSASGAYGKRVAQAQKYLDMASSGKKLLRSEKNIINKTFSPTQIRKAMGSKKK